ncbi:uncharacterized protein [Aristolochia californica]|uniref:uncharacterized protein n=1 Tax=Aristolochia californica TaxID=171875 RepID=UPI0035D6C14A
MASNVLLHLMVSPSSPSTAARPSVAISARPSPSGSVALPRKRFTSSVSAVGDVSADSTAYLIGGAVAVALIGTAFPIFFTRKDLCPECDGAGFVRQSGVALRANAARKDQAQIVCARCNGLGKLNQIDK